MSGQRIIVILNAASGAKDGDNKRQEITAAFEKHGQEVGFIDIQDHATVEAAAKAALEQSDASLAVAGGDGTICAVAGVLAGSGRTLGILPAGTFNYFARSIGVPEDLDLAVDTMVNGQARDVKIATINGQPFINNASIGAYAAILQTREGTYKRWGRSRIAAYWSVVKTLATFRAPLKLRIQIDGQRLARRTPIIFVVNNAYQLEQMGLDGADAIAQDKLVVLIAPNTGRLGLMRHAAALALGIAKRRTDYEMISGARIKIDMKRKRRPVARDGELSRMSGPFELHHAPGPLKVMVSGDNAGTVR